MIVQYDGDVDIVKPNTSVSVITDHVGKREVTVYQPCLTVHRGSLSYDAPGRKEQPPPPPRLFPGRRIRWALPRPRSDTENQTPSRHQGQVWNRRGVVGIAL